jgi:hypothetical protein
MQPLLPLFPPLVDFRFPAGGDMNMDFHPWTNWGEVDPNAGNQRIEDVIFRNVALPGRQLGRLIDVVRILVKIAGPSPEELNKLDKQDTEAITDFQSMADDIERHKDVLKETALTQARRSMERLRTSDRTAYERLLKDCQLDPEDQRPSMK